MLCKIISLKIGLTKRSHARRACRKDSLAGQKRTRKKLLKSSQRQFTTTFLKLRKRFNRNNGHLLPNQFGQVAEQVLFRRASLWSMSLGSRFSMQRTFHSKISNQKFNPEFDPSNTSPSERGGKREFSFRVQAKVKNIREPVVLDRWTSEDGMFPTLFFSAVLLCFLTVRNAIFAAMRRIAIVDLRRQRRFV